MLTREDVVRAWYKGPAAMIRLLEQHLGTTVNLIDVWRQIRSPRSTATNVVGHNECSRHLENQQLWFGFSTVVTLGV